MADLYPLSRNLAAMCPNPPRTVKKHLLMWACSISVHAVHLTSLKMKYELLIGGIHLMHNFVVNCAKEQAGLDTRSISIYGNISPFLECVLMIVSIFYLPLLKNGYISKNDP